MTSENTIKHILSYRFKEDNNYSQLEGTETEINEFLNDFNWHSANDILSNKYIRQAKIKPLIPLDRPVEYFITGNLANAKKISEAKQPISNFNKKLITNNIKRTILRQKRNREHESCFVRLHEFTTVTCSETGISFSVQLPIPEKLNLEVIHPLSFYQNVQDVIRTYSNQGIFLESELSAQVLSGMLLTILRHKKLLVCHDYIQANFCLQRAKSQTLSHAVRYFNGLHSTLSMPQLHLIPEAIYDFFHAPISLTKEQIIADRVEVMIQNFIKVCKGESEGETRIAGTILKTRKEKLSAKVKIYGGNIDIEHRQALNREKLGKQILVKLQTLFPVPTFSQAFYDMIYSKLDAFMFLGTEKRVEVSKQIFDKFGEHKLGRELANLFATTKTETMELGLSTFSQELEKDLGEWKGQKRKFNLFIKSVNEKELEP